LTGRTRAVTRPFASIARAGNDVWVGAFLLTPEKPALQEAIRIDKDLAARIGETAHSGWQTSMASASAFCYHMESGIQVW
jgi:hypothetical protein